MKKGIFLLLVLTQNVFSFQDNSNLTKWVEKRSEQFANALGAESTIAIKELFTTDVTLLPEYHSMLQGIPVGTLYFEEFFEKTKTITYQKHPFEILEFKDWLLELGTFKHQYRTPQDSTFDYNGKYMTFWKLENGVPNIAAHIWGASNYFAAENLTFVSIDTPEIPIDIPEGDWKDAIEAVRSYIYQAVLDNDAKTTMRSYAEDAIYMPYYDSPFFGKTQIANYFYPHYEPGTVQRDSLMTRAVRIIDLGSYALKFGEYHVEWTYEDQPSFIKGKGLALYRRKEDGGVEIYRQMINHSMPPTPKQ